MIKEALPTLHPKLPPPNKLVQIPQRLPGQPLTTIHIMLFNIADNVQAHNIHLRKGARFRS